MEEHEAYLPQSEKEPTASSIEGNGSTDGQDTMFRNRIDLTEASDKIRRIEQEIRKVIVGQDGMIELLIAAMLANGHVLIEGFPGVAKTLTAKLLASSISSSFSRIQFTPDLMPSDVLGTNIYNFKTSEFEFKQGPLFANMVLIDEINRAPAKTQSALFEVMEERQITIDGNTRKLPPPFIVLATQNPVEHEGTYRLPEAQLDRFLFKIEVGYPKLEDEVKILEYHHQQDGSATKTNIEAILTGEELTKLQGVVRKIHVDKNLMQYIAEIVNKTRNDKDLFLGASPRATLAILNGAKAIAVMNGRDFVTPDDIKRVAMPVLIHRIMLTPEKEMEGSAPAKVLAKMIHAIEVPR